MDTLYNGTLTLTLVGKAQLINLSSKLLGPQVAHAGLIPQEHELPNQRSL